MPVFDAKSLDQEFAGSAVLSSVLYATPEAKTEALARGLERLAQAGTSGVALGVGLPGARLELLSPNHHA